MYVIPFITTGDIVLIRSHAVTASFEGKAWSGSNATEGGITWALTAVPVFVGLQGVGVWTYNWKFLLPTFCVRVLLFHCDWVLDKLQISTQTISRNGRIILFVICPTVMCLGPTDVIGCIWWRENMLKLARYISQSVSSLYTLNTFVPHLSERHMLC